MTTSVAICTYNGEKYIEEQLLSIINQSHTVNEIILCDDGSFDNTLEICNRIAKEHPIINWNIIKNKHQLGVCDNFAQAFSLCSGDIIFLSDQDDIWRTDKVEKILNYFEEYTNKNTIFSNATIINSKGEHNTKYCLFDIVGFTSNIQKQFDEGWAVELFTYNTLATGATMAFRREILDNWNVSSKRNNIYGMPLHDIQLVFKSLEKNDLGYINDKLTYYRIHDKQTSGINYLLEHPAHFNILWDAYIGKFITEDDINLNLLNRMYFLRKRGVIKTHRFGYQIIKNTLNYIRIYGKLWYKAYYSDLKSSLKISFYHY